MGLNVQCHVFVGCLLIFQDDSRSLYTHEYGAAMYFRKKISEGRVYVQIAESRRQGSRVRQRVIYTRGGLDELKASGQMARVVRSGARFAEQAIVVSAVRADAVERVGSWRIGPALVFERLWQETGCQAVIEELASGRKYDFAVERAVFLSVLHRLFAPGSVGRRR